jgi:hypothetical protein
MMENYEDPGYAHWMSYSFRVAMRWSFIFFDNLTRFRFGPPYIPYAPPNTPVDWEPLSDSDPEGNDDHDYEGDDESEGDY